MKLSSSSSYSPPGESLSAWPPSRGASVELDQLSAGVPPMTQSARSPSSKSSKKSGAWKAGSVLRMFEPGAARSTSSLP